MSIPSSSSIANSSVISGLLENEVISLSTHRFDLLYAPFDTSLDRQNTLSRVSGDSSGSDIDSDSEDDDLDLADLNFEELVDELTESISCLIEVGPTLKRLGKEQYQQRKIQRTLTSTSAPSQIELSSAYGLSGTISSKPLDIENYWTLRIREASEAQKRGQRGYAMNENFVSQHEQAMERDRNNGLLDEVRADLGELLLEEWQRNLTQGSRPAKSGVLDLFPRSEAEIPGLKQSGTSMAPKAEFLSGIADPREEDPSKPLPFSWTNPSDVFGSMRTAPDFPTASGTAQPSLKRTDEQTTTSPYSPRSPRAEQSRLQARQDFWDERRWQSGKDDRKDQNAVRDLNPPASTKSSAGKLGIARPAGTPANRPDRSRRQLTFFASHDALAAPSIDLNNPEGDEETDPDSPSATRWCYCNRGSYGEMIGCDNPSCLREWFHLGCTDLKELPDEKQTWYCNDCDCAFATLPAMAQENMAGQSAASKAPFRLQDDDVSSTHPANFGMDSTQVSGGRAADAGSTAAPFAASARPRSSSPYELFASNRTDDKDPSVRNLNKRTKRRMSVDSELVEEDSENEPSDAVPVVHPSTSQQDPSRPGHRGKPSPPSHPPHELTAKQHRTNAHPAAQHSPFPTPRPRAADGTKPSTPSPSSAAPSAPSANPSCARNSPPRFKPPARR